MVTEFWEPSLVLVVVLVLGFAWPRSTCGLTFNAEGRVRGSRRGRVQNSKLFLRRPLVLRFINIWRLDILKARSASEGLDDTGRLRSGLSSARLTVPNSRFVQFYVLCRVKRRSDHLLNANARLSTNSQAFRRTRTSNLQINMVTHLSRLEKKAWRDLILPGGSAARCAERLCLSAVAVLVDRGCAPQSGAQPR